MSQRANLKTAKRWVIKIGSALLTNNGQGLDQDMIERLVAQIEVLLAEDKEVVLVSSGAVAAGVSCLKLSQRPSKINELQAAAAVGQMSLIQAYESRFQKYGRQSAQILLTHDDLSNRTRYLNAKSTILELLKLGVVPVINENDTVATDEIRFGDNDNLAALVANLIQADAMVILTNQDGMFEQDPRDNPNATLLDNLDPNDRALKEMASGSKDGLGRGGMITKVQSAALAARSGTVTIIANGASEDVLAKISRGELVGSLFLAKADSESSRKQWLASHLQMAGELVIDDGAVRVLREGGSSLLSVGVREVRGNFSRGEMVACLNLQGEQIVRGLVNYNADETRKIAGKSSDEIASVLGYVDQAELIHRDNLVLVS